MTCKECGLKIGKGKKFCNNSCAAKYNNIRRKKTSIQCLHCGKDIHIQPRFINVRKFCNSTCAGAYKYIKCKDRNRERFEKGELVNRTRIREFLTENYGYNCSICNISKWNNKPITLWVDHIDGNAGNNNKDNLRLICPNCDSQSNTFMAKNKGSGRKSRGLKLY